jgi:hypothetical protein
LLLDAELVHGVPRNQYEKSILARASIVKRPWKNYFAPPQQPNYTSPLELAKRSPVTVCLAAECVHNDQPAIVLCCDWQGTTPYAKTDNVDKIRHEGKVSIMLADHPSYADELIDECTPAITAFAVDCPAVNYDLHIDALLSGMRSAVTRQKGKIIDSWFGRNFGRPYQDFLDNKMFFLPKERKKLHKKIRKLSLNASIIVCGINNSPQQNAAAAIVVVDSEGTVYEVEHIAAIGSGSFIAHPFLLQFDWLGKEGKGIPLMQCMWRVYTAKVAAEIDPTVGITSSMEVLCGSQRYVWTQELADRLRKLALSQEGPPLDFQESFLAEEKD